MRLLNDTVSALQGIFPEPSNVVPDEVQDIMLEINYTLEEAIIGSEESTTRERLEMIENMLTDLRKELAEQFANN